MRPRLTSGQWTGTVGVAEHLGSDTFVHVKVDGLGTLTARASGDLPLKHGQTVHLTPAPDRIYRFDAQGLAI